MASNRAGWMSYQRAMARARLVDAKLDTLINEICILAYAVDSLLAVSQQIKGDMQLVLGRNDEKNKPGYGENEEDVSSQDNDRERVEG